MKILTKVIASILFLLVTVVVALSLYLELRDKEYHSIYQRIDVAEKWELENAIRRKYLNKQPSRYLIDKDELFLLVQSTEFISVAHTAPWTKEKIDKYIPEEVQKKYLSNLSSDSWFHKETPRPPMDVDLLTEEPESND